MEIIGYHGTSKKAGKAILKDNFRPSGEDEWFGKGVYFFETAQPYIDGIDEAKNWAVYVKKITNWVVIESTIKGDRFIDLVGDISHRNEFDKVKNMALKAHTRFGHPRETFTDGIVFLRLAELGNIDFVRAFVDAKRENRYNSNVVRRPQIQICVKKVGVISKTAIVLES